MKDLDYYLIDLVSEAVDNHYVSMHDQLAAAVTEVTNKLEELGVKYDYDEIYAEVEDDYCSKY